MSNAFSLLIRLTVCSGCGFWIADGRALAVAADLAVAPLGDASWAAAVIWYLLLAFTATLGAPLVLALDNEPRPWMPPLFRIAGIAWWAWVVWFSVSLGIFSYSRFSFLFLGCLLILVSLFLWVLFRRRAAALFRTEILRVWLLSELLFAAAFAGFILLKAYNPDIDMWERPSEFAYYNALARAEELPPLDPWIAGEPLNYYYYGWHLQVMPGKLMGVPTSVSYNLGVAVTAGLTLLGALAFGIAFTRRLGGAIAGALFVTFAGSYEPLKQIIINRRFHPFDWFRTAHSPISHTISEFPYWSYLYGDLHPHIVVLPFTIGLLALLAAWIRRQSEQPILSRPQIIWSCAVISLILGSAYAVHPWELPLYGSITYLVLLAISRAQPGRAAEGEPYSVQRSSILPPTLFALTPPVLAAVMFFPYALGFNRKPPLSLALTLEITPENIKSYTTLPREFALVFGFFIILIVQAYAWHLVQQGRRRGWGVCQPGVGGVLAIGFVFIGAVEALTGGGISRFALMWLQQPTEVNFAVGLMALGASILLSRVANDASAPPERRGAFALAALALFIIAGDEFVHLSDFLGGGPWRRMNSIFKFHFQSWILLALATPALSAVAFVRPDVPPSSLRRRWQMGLLLTMSAAWAILVLLALMRLLPVWVPVVALQLPAGAWVLWMFTNKYGAETGFDRLPGRAARGSLAVMLAIAATPVFIFPFAGTYQKISERSNARGERPVLDGLAFRQKHYPHEYTAISWLRENALGQPVILESTGPSYQRYSRISMNTGLPTVLGWTSHTVSKGFNWSEVQQRAKDIDTMYREPGSDEALAALNRYRVVYIIVGDVERLTYPDCDLTAQFTSRPDLFRTVFAEGDVTIFQINFEHSNISPAKPDQSQLPEPDFQPALPKHF